MDATNRIAEAFDHLVALGREGVAKRPAAERIVYSVVVTRCEIDMEGFESVYEQALNPAELAILVDGLNQIGESELAGRFHHGFELLQQVGFYEHMNWKKVPAKVKGQIRAIGERVEDHLWDLDQKLATLLDQAGRATSTQKKATSMKKKTKSSEKAAKRGASPSLSKAARTNAPSDWRAKMLARIRTLIKQADPDVVEEVKWRKPSNGMVGVPVWSHGGILCTGETYKKVVKVTFAKGASLPDPAGLFNSSLEGNTRRAIDFQEGDKIDEKAFKALIHAAVALNTSAGAKAARPPRSPKKPKNA